MPPAPAVLSELQAGLLQATITTGLVALCAFLYQRYRKPYLFWWAVAWSLYVVRLGAIMTFLATTQRIWLYWHQVITGWVALALLWAALLFSRRRRWRRSYLVLVLFPPVWSYLAIYQMKDFLLAAGPAVLFLSLATLWTGWIFFSYRRQTGSGGAALLGGTFLLWGLHHLDYPVLRAQGAWAPWGYYLDILFALSVGAGILLLVLEDARRGLAALAALSGDLQRREGKGDVLDSLLARPLTLAGVRGSAMYLGQDRNGAFVRGVGACAPWTGSQPVGAAAETIARAVAAGRPAFSSEWNDGRTSGESAYAYAAVLPVFRHEVVTGALVMVGDAHDPFTALDESFLLALGQQVGAALETADLHRRLQARTAELEHLSTRMVEQHEEERRRLSLELHDETAQVFSSVKMQLGVAREQADPALARRLDRALQLIDTGMLSIRNITNDLRPSLLDDLGLLPALRSLVAEFAGRSGLEARLEAPETLPAMSSEAELALFRALQEGLTNVARHAEAERVIVEIGVEHAQLVVRVRDNGRGFDSGPDLERFERDGHLGLAGMRERITALGGTLDVKGGPGPGVGLEILLPIDGGTRG